MLAQTSVDAYEDHGTYVYDYSTTEDPFIVFNKDSSSGRWWSGEFQVTRTFARRHHLTAGTEWRYAFRGNQNNYDEPDHYVHIDSRKKTTDTGTYIQGELALSDNLLLSSGIRYDYYSTFGGVTNPRFGLVYSPWAKTTAKVLYGHAFRAPSLYEMYYQDNVSSKANPNLQPENIKTLELVMEQYVGRKCRIAASAYKYRVEHQIVSVIDPTDNLIVFENSGNVEAKGIELELEGKDLHGIDGRLSYALQKAKRSPGGATLVNSPQHLVQLSLFKPLFGMKGGTGVELRYMSSRKTLADRHVVGFLLTTVTLFHRNLLPNLDLSASIFNVFNKRYSDPGGSEHVSDALQQDGRSFRIRLGCGFSVK
jgi:iron complex outermembrane receptor protein